MTFRTAASAPAEPSVPTTMAFIAASLRERRRAVENPRMAAALGWGALAASSLVVGAVLGLAWRWPERLVGLVLAFGAGALISAVSFDLAEEGGRIGGPGTVGVGLAVGALTYFLADRALDRGSSGAGTALALGASSTGSRSRWCSA